jgi:hypothetical protein
MSPSVPNCFPQNVSISFNNNSSTPQGDGPGHIFINFGTYKDMKHTFAQRRSRSPTRNTVARLPDLTGGPMFARGRFVPVGVPAPESPPLPGVGGFVPPPPALAAPAMAAPLVEAHVMAAPVLEAPVGDAPGAGAPMEDAPDAGTPEEEAPVAVAPVGDAPGAGTLMGDAPDIGAPEEGAPDAGAPDVVDTQDGIHPAGIEGDVVLIH